MAHLSPQHSGYLMYIHLSLAQLSLLTSVHMRGCLPSYIEEGNV